MLSIIHNLRETCPAKPTLGNQRSLTVPTQPRGNRAAEVQSPKVCMNFDLPRPRRHAIAEAAPCHRMPWMGTTNSDPQLSGTRTGPPCHPCWDQSPRRKALAFKARTLLAFSRGCAVPPLAWKPRSMGAQRLPCYCAWKAERLHLSRIAGIFGSGGLQRLFPQHHTHDPRLGR